LQSTIALSTCEAEYYAVGKTAQLVAENREKLAELNFVQSHPTVINEDNQSTIAVVNKATSGSKLRHVKLKHHYIKELIKDKDIVLQQKK
jgi:aspartate oxidase